MPEKIRVEFAGRPGIVRAMRRSLLPLLSLALLLGAAPVFGATGRVLKVLPHFLDLKGRHALSPSLSGSVRASVRLYQLDAHRLAQRPRHA